MNKIVKVTVIPKPQPVKIERVILDIPIAYAETLMRIFHHIGGPYEGPRGHCEHMSIELSAAKVKLSKIAFEGPGNGDSLYFKN